MASTREDHVQMAKLAQEGQRYEDMVDFMEKVAVQSDGELTEEERRLLYEAYTNLIGSRRAFRNCISSVDQKMSNISVIAVDSYKTKIETEMSTICFRILKLLDLNLIPSAADTDSKQFYLEWKRHIHSCLAVFMDRNARKEAAYQTEHPVVPDNVSRYEQDFKHISRLGKGGFGKVYLAVHKLDKKSYAVKMVKVTRKNSDEAISEARIMSRLCHIHIMMYHQAWFDSFLEDIYNTLEEDDSEPSSEEEEEDSKKVFLCIQMELCDRTLHEDLIPGSYQFDRENAANTFKQILEGVAYMHEQGTVHSDLTPKNIFIDSKNQVKIGDFGLATSSTLDDQGFDSSIIKESGNPYYKAPETQLGAKKTEKMDMYSLGIIWFELCTEFGSGMERSEKITEVKKGIIPDDWVAICPELAKLISSNPFHRPSARNILDNNIL